MAFTLRRCKPKLLYTYIRYLFKAKANGEASSQLTILHASSTMGMSWLVITPRDNQAEDVVIQYLHTWRSTIRS